MNDKQKDEAQFLCPLYEEEIGEADCADTVRLVKSGRVPRGGEGDGEWLTTEEVCRRSALCYDCPHNENVLLDRAIELAVRHCAGKDQWGTGRPAVLLPLETMQVLQSMRADVRLLIAGVIYTADLPRAQVAEIFGEDMAALTAAAETDPAKEPFDNWMAMFEALKGAERRRQMLVLADTVAALRALWRDYEELGDAVWAYFDHPSDVLSWFYSGMLDALQGLEQDEAVKPVYWEASSLYKDIFVTYLADFEHNVLYEMPEGLEIFGLTKADCQWVPLEELPKELQCMPENGLPLRRWDVEEILDLWVSEKDAAQRKSPRASKKSKKNT